MQSKHNCELMRSEYLSLLYAAKRLKQERTYFLIKTICGVGIKIGELLQFTVELLRAGSGILKIRDLMRRSSMTDLLNGLMEIVCAFWSCWRMPVNWSGEINTSDVFLSMNMIFCVDMWSMENRPSPMIKKREESRRSLIRKNKSLLVSLPYDRRAG